MGEWIRSEVIESGQGSLDEGDRGQTGGGDRTSSFQAASYPGLMEGRARKRKTLRRGTAVNSRHLALSLAGRGKPDDFVDGLRATIFCWSWWRRLWRSAL